MRARHRVSVGHPLESTTLLFAFPLLLLLFLSLNCFGFMNAWNFRCIEVTFWVTTLSKVIYVLLVVLSLPKRNRNF